MIEAKDERNPIEVAADEFTERLRRGEFPTIEEYLERYPQYADELIELLPTVAAMENLRSLEDRWRHMAQSQGTRIQLNQRIDDFELLRVIGRGGMGVVYEAEQLSLHRRVALKILTHSVASSESQIARFRREAEAAARLHHTNIVPVFGSGEHQDLHYYVMQLIEGPGLDEIIAELSRQRRGDFHGDDAWEPEPPPSSARRAAWALRKGSFTPSVSGSLSARAQVTTRLSISPSAETRDAAISVPPPPSAEPGDQRPEPAAEQEEDNEEAAVPLAQSYWRSVARLGVQLADALDYAHRQGILHRDIKPSNLLLDHDGVIWITDFGLAKHEDLEAVTRSGDTLGTLRYMAPEQFSGQADARSDVYALGLTLYELLTLQPAFDDTQHGAIIRKKTTTEPRRPRSWNRSIPRDLETIVLKACAPSPRDRYAHAGELKADLQRYLEDRPIQARRVSEIERLYRWARRNPMTALLSSSAACLLVAVAILLAVGNYRSAHALKHVQAERSNAQLQHARAEANLTLAVQAFEDIIRNMADRGAPRAVAIGDDETELVPQEIAVTEADAELLRRLLGFFDQFARQNRADLKVETARAQRCMGDIHQRLGQLEPAEQAYRAAADIYREIVLSDPENTRSAISQAETLNDLAAAIMKLDDPRRAFAVLQQAQDLFDRSTGLLDTPDGQFQLARTLNLLGANRLRPGSMRPVAGRGKPAAGEPPRTRVRPPGTPAEFNALLERFAAENERAGQLLAALVQNHPANTAYRLEQIQWYRNQIGRQLVRGEWARAEEARALAIVQMEQAVADFSRVPDFKYALADSLLRSTRGPQAPGQQAGVKQRVDRAVAIARGLCAAHPHVPDYPALLGRGLSRQAEIAREQNDYLAARELFAEALTYRAPLATRFAGIGRYQLRYLRTVHDLAAMQQQLGDSPASLATLQEAASSVEALEQESAGNRFFRRVVRDHYRDLAAALEREGESAAAADIREKARQLGTPRRGRGGSRDSANGEDSSEKPG